MIITVYTPEGEVEIDSDTVTDDELAELNITRASLLNMVPRDLAGEVDDVKTRLKALEKSREGLEE